MKFAFKSLVMFLSFTLATKDTSTDKDGWSIEKKDLDFIGDVDKINDNFMNIIKDGSKCIYDAVNKNGISKELE